MKNVSVVSIKSSVVVVSYGKSKYRVLFIPNLTFFVLLGLFLFSGFLLIVNKVMPVENKNLKIEHTPLQLRILSAQEVFQIRKQELLTLFKVKYKVNDIRKLSNSQKLELSRQLYLNYVSDLLPELQVSGHVHYFLTDTVQINKIQTAIMEQLKYDIPASITLAQAALETSYGRKVIGNNYFGIKDKTRHTKPVLTREFFTASEFRANRDKIIKYKKIKQNLYECIIKDSFQAYPTAWHSFRARSEYLTKNSRYAPLFEQGNNYKEWADKIGSVHQGGVGYATNPNYGNLMKDMIERYAWHLLDF